MLYFRQKQYGIFILSALSWLTLDLMTKYIAWRHLTHPVVFVENLLYFSLHQNFGIAFGIFFGRWLQILASVGVLGALLYFGFRQLLPKRLFLNSVLLGIISGGAIGNLVNRIHPGYVIDFIAFWSLPVFNVADIGICAGLALLILMELKSKT